MRFEEKFPSYNLQHYTTDKIQREFVFTDDLEKYMRENLLDKQRVFSIIQEVCGHEGSTLLEPLGEKILEKLK